MVKDSLISELVPVTVVAEEAYSDPLLLDLYPEEEAVLANAVDHRRLEFATVRMCARKALGRLGIEPGPLLPGLQRAPVWPVGIVGSMTHCDGYRAAVVGRTSSVISIGIDAEPHIPLPPQILNLVTLEKERLALLSLSLTHPAVAWERVLFSAKESVFKVWFPLTKQQLSFTECEINFQPDEFTFSATLLVPEPVIHGIHRSTFSGRWSISAPLGAGHIGTAIVIE